MPDLTFLSRQARGKVRRFIQSSLLKREAETLLSKRRGECNRCGACCKILFRCPFLKTLPDGQFSCRVYDLRFEQCRLYPIQARDLLEVKGECSYTFESEPETISATTLASAAE